MVSNRLTKLYQILISGGITRERESGIEDVNEYNPDFDQWMTRASMNQARDSHTMIPKEQFVTAVLGFKASIKMDCFYRHKLFVKLCKGKNVYVIGGQEKSRAGVEVYSIEKNQWTELQTAPRIQYMAACGLANSKIFMIGGWITDTG